MAIITGYNLTLDAQEWHKKLATARFNPSYLNIIDIIHWWKVHISLCCLTYLSGTPFFLLCRDIFKVFLFRRFVFSACF